MHPPPRRLTSQKPSLVRVKRQTVYLFYHPPESKFFSLFLCVVDYNVTGQLSFSNADTTFPLLRNWLILPNVLKPLLTLILDLQLSDHFIFLMSDLFHFMLIWPVTFLFTVHCGFNFLVYRYWLSIILLHCRSASPKLMQFIPCTALLVFSRFSRLNPPTSDFFCLFVLTIDESDPPAATCALK